MLNQPNDLAPVNIKSSTTTNTPFFSLLYFAFMEQRVPGQRREGEREREKKTLIKDMGHSLKISPCKPTLILALSLQILDCMHKIFLALTL